MDEESQFQKSKAKMSQLKASEYMSKEVENIEEKKECSRL